MRKSSFLTLWMISALLSLPRGAYSEYGDIVIDRHAEVMTKVGLNAVAFPHWFHRIRYKCKVCHEDIFLMKKGENDITMASIVKGDFCGKCHNGKIAWDPLYCDRCHSFKPQQDGHLANIPAGDNSDENKIYLDSSGKLAGTGDPNKFAGEVYKIGLGWHPAALNLSKAPKDQYGLINWVEMLKNKLINPKESLDLQKKDEEPPFDMDIVMPAKTGLIEGAYFPHSTHNLWLGCESCHVKLFLPASGVNNLTMSEVVKGNACGVCHGKVAFPLNDCARCHKPKQELQKIKTETTNKVSTTDKKTDKKR